MLWQLVLVGWLAGWLTDWLTDWLIDWVDNDKGCSVDWCSCCRPCCHLIRPSPLRKEQARKTCRRIDFHTFCLVCDTFPYLSCGLISSWFQVRLCYLGMLKGCSCTLGHVLFMDKWTSSSDSNSTVTGFIIEVGHLLELQVYLWIVQVLFRPLLFL